MREIKFRAWDLNNEAMFTYEDMGDVYFGLCNNGSMELIDCAGEVNTPLQAIFMQYTGLKNHLGIEIWFDDVWYIAGYGNLHVKDVWDIATLTDALAEGDVEQCLGNIHQHPELLEGDS